MIGIQARNVNQAYALGMELLRRDGRRESSRNGDVIVAPWPVITSTTNPTERVLFDARRDANPFFHLFEALWMLAGRDDAESLNRYVKNFGERFAEPDGHVHGAYGPRWRQTFGVDQLDVVVERLRQDPTTRQCVVQMWDARQGHQEHCGENDLLGFYKDRPCNTHIYLRVRDAADYHAHGPYTADPVLDLTVCCRSNDAVWGAHGANVVHFSFLQEYLAGRVGVGVGQLYQLSNNYHAYVAELDRVGEPEPYAPFEYPSTLPIGNDWGAWDRDLKKFMDWHDDGCPLEFAGGYKNEWFHNVATPMCHANKFRRGGMMRDAMVAAEQVAAEDWREAAVAWLNRRKK